MGSAFYPLMLAPLTGLELYNRLRTHKSDTVCIELDRSNNVPRRGGAMSENEQLKRRFTDAERRRLVDYFSLLVEIDQQEKHVMPSSKIIRKGSLWTAKAANADYVLNPYMILPAGSINRALNAPTAKMP